MGLACSDGFPLYRPRGYRRRRLHRATRVQRVVVAAISIRTIRMALALDDLWPPATHARSRAVAVHNRFRDLDERWKSASTGRRNRLPHLLRQTIDPARWGRRFRLPFQWPQSTVGIYDEQIQKTVKHPPARRIAISRRQPRKRYHDWHTAGAHDAADNERCINMKRVVLSTVLCTAQYLMVAPLVQAQQGRAATPVKLYNT